MPIYCSIPRRCPWCAGTGITNLPRRMPKHIREWLSINPEVPSEALVCPEHGKWFEDIDSLAPYHWETCRCPDCK